MSPDYPAKIAGLVEHEFMSFCWLCELSGNCEHNRTRQTPINTTAKSVHEKCSPILVGKIPSKSAFTATALLGTSDRVLVECAICLRPRLLLLFPPGRSRLGQHWKECSPSTRYSFQQGWPVFCCRAFGGIRWDRFGGSIPRRT